MFSLLKPHNPYSAIVDIYSITILYKMGTQNSMEAFAKRSIGICARLQGLQHIVNIVLEIQGRLW